MESYQENRWRRLRRDIRGDRLGDEGAGGPQVGVCQAAQTGSQDGGGGAEETTRSISVNVSKKLLNKLPILNLRSSHE